MLEIFVELSIKASRPSRPSRVRGSCYIKKSKIASRDPPVVSRVTTICYNQYF